jgi:glutathionylspermidine synthase
MEDQATALYVADCASQAGLRMQAIAIEDIGWDRQQCAFVDMAAQPIHTLFKLYPTEWLMQEAFGAQLPSSNVQWLEPPWKLLLSSKAILPLLWDLHPRHPNLLPAFLWRSPRQGRLDTKAPLFPRGGQRQPPLQRPAVGANTRRVWPWQGHPPSPHPTVSV